jgi:SpoIID/LytB domain protein
MEPSPMRRRISIALVLALAASLALPLAGTPAMAASSFRFRGSGYGHGLGMSQWGAEGLAEMGWGYKRILTHFYRGTKIVRDDGASPRIRVGLTEDRSSVHLTAKGGPVKVWLDAPKTGTLVGTIRRGTTWTVIAKDRAYLLRDQDGARVGDRRWGGPRSHLFLTYADGARVFIPETDEIWGQGFSYGRGTIELNLYACGDACRLRLIARLTMETYLYGLGEVPASWPMASLRAQAVAARSYATYALRRYGLRGSCNCNLTDGAGDQVYAGWSKESGELGARWKRAVDSTGRQLATYRGNVIQAFYAASDGGHSEDVEDVWHGGNPDYATPWLRGVCNPGEWVSQNPWLDWVRTFDAATVTARLASATGPIGTVKRFGTAVRGESGRIVTIVVKGTSGSRVVEGSTLRSALGLPDGRVWINQDRNITGAIRAVYDRLGCAPGLAESATRQVDGGSQQFFEVGGLYRNTGRDLTVWLKGQLDAEYRAVRAGAGALGVPVSGVRSLRTTCTNCKRIDFVGGRIYWKGGLGAHALFGPVLDAYLGAGGAGGSLGFPVTRSRRTPAGGWKARFEHGDISCDAGGACVVSST